jgi:hypothetical protein
MVSAIASIGTVKCRSDDGRSDQRGRTQGDAESRIRNRAVATQSQIIYRNVVSRTDGLALTCVLCPRSIPAFPTPLRRALVQRWPRHRLARANRFSGVGLEHSLGRPNANKAAGATFMRVDLQQVDTEIAALRSRLAAINDDLDECRIGYFEHPWAWSQMRRMLTSERHRVQRRLDEFTFVRECVGGRQQRSIATPSFRSLEGLDQITFRLIQGGRS